jgi:hypothetical protein
MHPKGIRLAIDRACLRAVIELLDIPREQWAACFAKVRILEQTAVKAMNGSQ